MLGMKRAVGGRLGIRGPTYFDVAENAGALTVIVSGQINLAVEACIENVAQGLKVGKVGSRRRYGGSLDLAPK